VAQLTRAALRRTRAERATLAVDDLTRCDALTVATLVALHEELASDPAFIVTAGRAPSQITQRFHAMLLEGFDPNGVSAFISGDHGPVMPPSIAKRQRVLPLYLENVHALGEVTPAEEGTLPPRLADVVMARIDRLRVPARRMLQAICTLGTRAPLELVREVGSITDMAGIDELSERGLVSISGLEVEVTHPFVAEIVEASIPAEARRALHRRAHKILLSRDTPVEVLAEHAYRTGDPMLALVLLERMGDLGLRRGDPLAGVLAFRRALELARREALESGDALMDGATLTFSRKLAEAMIASGELPAAEGVLREAFDLAPPDSVERAKVHWLLARVSVKRARLREAMRQLGLALEIAGDRSPELEARIQYLLARVRAAEGDPRHATTALARALDLCDKWAAPASLRAEMRVELGTLLGQVGMDDQARTHLARAAVEARTDEAPALAAAAIAAVAVIDGARGHVADARARLAEAAELAAIAGDAPNARAYRAALAA
jgi:ATP/maltotriose-dependent transcriptional regulator MalT